MPATVTRTWVTPEQANFYLTGFLRALQLFTSQHREQRCAIKWAVLVRAQVEQIKHGGHHVHRNHRELTLHSVGSHCWRVLDQTNLSGASFCNVSLQQPASALCQRPKGLVRAATKQNQLLVRVGQSRLVRAAEPVSVRVRVPVMIAQPSLATRHTFLPLKPAVSPGFSKFAVPCPPAGLTSGPLSCTTTNYQTTSGSCGSSRQ